MAETPNEKDGGRTRWPLAEIGGTPKSILLNIRSMLLQDGICTHNRYNQHRGQYKYSVRAVYTEYKYSVHGFGTVQYSTGVLRT
jgi:hypothetical protein